MLRIPWQKGSSVFVDNNFPATKQSLGRLFDGGDLVWFRLPDICAAQDVPLRLFHGTPKPSHIKQGRLGDCWLLCALACLSSQPGGLERCFKKPDVSRVGRYTVRLFSCAQRRWTELTIDDRLPCDELTGKLAYARTADGSAWVPLLEKAMAKLGGSYAVLHGGNTAWALRTLTGKPCFKYRFDDTSGRWRRHELLYSKKCLGPTFQLAKTRCYIDGSAMFRLLLREHQGGALIAASSGQGEASLKPGSKIRPGHAYAVTKVIEVQAFRLLKLWGPSRECAAVTVAAAATHPPPSDRQTSRGLSKLLESLNRNQEEGMFWMPWSEFRQYFYTLEFCTEHVA